MHLTSSAKPGQKDNVVIYGHNWRRLFGPLRDVKVGDSIEITTADAQKHLYVVNQTFSVKPDAVWIADHLSTETLTLYTCDGIFDNTRFVVRALPEINNLTQ